MAHEGARVGVTMHGIIIVLVSALLLVLYLTVAQGLPRSAFAVTRRLDQEARLRRTPSHAGRMPSPSRSPEGEPAPGQP